MNARVVSWLTGEVADLLSLGSVGLYEFIWTLRSAHPELPIETQSEIAEAALAELRAAREVVLVRLVWPSDQDQPLRPGDDVLPHDWSDIGADGNYLAIRPAPAE